MKYLKYVIGVIVVALIALAMQYIVDHQDYKSGLSDWGIAKDNPMKGFK
jgi:hypothetical protein